MNRSLLFTVGVGLVSGVLFAGMSMATPLALVTGYFIPLPLLVVGLSLGAKAGAIAGASALVVVVAAAGLSAALIFMALFALPALVLVRQSLLFRSAEGSTEWYPPGLIVSDVTRAALSVVVISLVIAILGTGSADLAAELRGFIEQALMSLPVEMSDEEFSVNAANLARWMPGFVAVSWVLMILLNGVVAQWLVTRSNAAQRPNPLLRDITIPTWWYPIAGGGIVAFLISAGSVQILASACMMLALLPIGFQGLAVVHTLAAKTNMRIFVLIMFYFAAMAFLPILFGLFILGTADSFAQLRRRMS
ncbi:MAG: DUF2232 domain-containing protein [Geminicoccaceae bacterium]